MAPSCFYYWGCSGRGLFNELHVIVTKHVVLKIPTRSVVLMRPTCTICPLLGGVIFTRVREGCGPCWVLVWLVVGFLLDMVVTVIIVTEGRPATCLSGCRCVKQT